MTSIVFPGQGSQYTSMAIDFNENFKIAKEVFEEVESSTNTNIRKIITENPNNKLNQTNFTQISIFAASIAIYKTLINEVGLDNINPEIVLGHSLGEYSALTSIDVLSISDAAKLIKIRGDLMNSAIEPNISGMAAIIGKNSDFIEGIIEKHNLSLEIANDNSPKQIVVSGLIKDIKEAEKIFISEGVKRYIKLNVSAAFHSKFMLESQKKLNFEIDKVVFLSSKSKIISIYNALINKDINDIVNSLKKQMANRVMWTDSIKQLETTNVFKVIEIGPGNVLSGLISRISNKFDIKTINKIEDLKKFS